MLDLGRLPNANGSKTDLIPVVSQLRFLDLIVQDDSDVDYVLLEILTCECRTRIIAIGDTNTCSAVVTWLATCMPDVLEETSNLNPVAN